MSPITFFPGQRVHIVGIGGAGMSAIARVLLQRGVQVSGSDRDANWLTEALAREGAIVHIGHDAAHVAGAELVIITAAAAPAHVEIAAARAAGIPVFKRADILQPLLAGREMIAVAGTHGKTTTTSMITHILMAAGRDPGYIIGGLLPTTGVNAAVGGGRAFVIEADEYDYMFLGLRPQVAVINNIEWDHPDMFPRFDVMRQAFADFAALVQPDGVLIAGADDPDARALADSRRAAGVNVVTFAIDGTADWRAVDLVIDASGTTFTVTQGGENVGRVALQVPGKHNVLNALAAIAACSTQGVALDEAARPLATFTGAKRRFEVRADRDGIAVIDDYAHHPTAIRVTLEAARARYPGRALWAVWQPHTYSRTMTLLDEFAGAFAAADGVIVTLIFSAREMPTTGVESDTAVEAVAARHPRVFGAYSLEEVVETLLDVVTAPAVIMILSAGTANAVGIEYLERRARAKDQDNTEDKDV